MIKHTIQLEFMIPENHGDLCWTSDNSGSQLYYDLLSKHAISSILRLMIKAENDKESYVNYISYLESMITLIDDIKVTDLGTTQLLDNKTS